MKTKVHVLNVGSDQDYVLEMTHDLSTGIWETVTEVMHGDGTEHVYDREDDGERARYRVRTRFRE